MRGRKPTYLGMAELSPDQLQVEVEIDDPDRRHWRGELHAAALRARLHEGRVAEIRLLDGGRSGETATCVVVEEDGWPAVVGQTSFQPVGGPVGRG